MKKLNLYFIIVILLASKSLFSGFWDKVENVANKMEEIDEKKSKIDRIQDAADRTTAREREKARKQREKRYEQKQKNNQRKMMEQQICSQYSMMDSPMMKKAYSQNPKMRKNMIKQTELSINSINIEYEKQFGSKYNYKKYCK